MSDMARISLTNIGVVGHHGYHEAEKELGQRFEVDVDLFVDVAVPGESDKLSDAVNYEKVYELVESIVQEDHFSLLEALATDIIDALFEEFEVEGVTLRIRKPAIPFCPNMEFVEIELSRGELLE